MAMASPASPRNGFLVRALHSFSPASLPRLADADADADRSDASATCLAFERGQLLRCFTRDPSGWWDGHLVAVDDGRVEVNGAQKRGWFPSNYVEILEPTDLDHDHDHDHEAARLLLLQIRNHADALELAVLARSKRLYQPSTAHVISSIRTVLSSTGCLTRDAAPLKRFPPLASARKRILTSLAQLVNAARRASAPAPTSASNENNDEEEEAGEEEEEETEANRELVRITNETVRLVEAFLDRARQVGVVPVPIPATDDGDRSGERRGSEAERGALIQTEQHEEEEEDEIRNRDRGGHTAPPDTPRLLRQEAAQSPLLLERRAGAQDRPSVEASLPPSAATALVTPPTTTTMSGAAVDRPTASSSFSSTAIAATAAAATVVVVDKDHSDNERDAAAAAAEVVVRLTSAAQLSVYLSTLHDALCSTLGSLIDQLELPSSNPDADAVVSLTIGKGTDETTTTTTTTRFVTRLVNSTTEAIVRVRDLMAVVDRIGEAATATATAAAVAVVSSRTPLSNGNDDDDKEAAKGLDRLRREREGLSRATTALVNAAKDATTSFQHHQQQHSSSQEQQQQRPCATATTDGMSGSRRQTRGDPVLLLLEATRAVLGSGTECVSALDQIGRTLFAAAAAAAAAAASASVHSNEEEQEERGRFELVLPKSSSRTVEMSSRPAGAAAAVDSSAYVHAQGGEGEVGDNDGDDGERVSEEGRGGGTLALRGEELAPAAGGDTREPGVERTSATLPESVETSRTTKDANLGDAGDRGGNGDADDGKLLRGIETDMEGLGLTATGNNLLSTSPIDTLAPAVPAFAAAPSTNDSGSSSGGLGRRGSDSTTSMMMRQQSTESAHSQTSSHVTNLSLATSSCGSAALTNHTAETSPRTSLAASGYLQGRKRISASSMMSAASAGWTPASRPPSRTEPHLTALAIPARLSSNSLLRSDVPMASPSLPLNYVLPTPSSQNLLTSPTFQTAAAAAADGSSASPSRSPSSSSALGTVTKHTSGAASSATSGGVWYLERDYEPREISFNADGHVSGGTLRCLVERMTLHDTTIDAAFSNTFLLTFRIFAAPLDLARLLWARFDLSPPTHPDSGAALSPEELRKWTTQKLTPVRLRVYNLFKTWVEWYWVHDQDREIVDDLLDWTEGRLRDALPAPSKRLAELVHKRVAASTGGAIGGARRSSFPSEFGVRLGGTPSSAGFASSTAPSGGVAGSAGESTGSSSSNHTTGGGRARGFLSRMQSTDRLRQGSVSSSMSINSPASSLPTGPGAGGDVFALSPDTSTAPRAPPPLISKSLIAALRPTLSGRSPLLTSIAELDPLELARQLTIMESRIYCSIRPEELFAAAISGSDTSSSAKSPSTEGPNKAQNVRKMSALSTRLTGWIAEAILTEHDQKRRTGLVKFFIKLGNHLLALGNYNAVFAVFAALSSSTISRLQKTWDGLAPKYKAIFGTLRKATDHARNYAEYRQKVRQALPPCLPFVGLFLTDLIFVYEGNRAERVSPADPDLLLINFDRYQKMARVVGELQRFQSPYALVEVPELQSYLAYELDSLKIGQDAQSLYRQSLMIEPRQGETPASSAASFVSSHSGHRAGRELFNWRA
ncbi:hypothetical protein JCM3774_006545 [Rhodotorula dairenensis]